MKTLSEANGEKIKLYRLLTTYPKYNGVACDECGHELQDLDNKVLASNPPKKRVCCPNCGIRAHRIA